jgi:hypothetical protein
MRAGLPTSAARKGVVPTVTGALLLLAASLAGACGDREKDESPIAAPVDRTPATSPPTAHGGVDAAAPRTPHGTAGQLASEEAAASMPMAGAGGAPQGGAAGSPATPDSPMNVRPRFQPMGTAIKAERQIWTWVPFTDSKCSSGSMGGLGVSLNPDSKNVMIFLDGGGACFNAETCSSFSTPDSVVRQQPSELGIFDRTHPENPIADWSYVFIPYCTGDVHLGANDEGRVEGIERTFHFVGRNNLVAFMHRVVPTFFFVDRVLLVGISSGGFGASANAPFVQWAFGDVPITMVNDSGPTLSEQFVPRCLRDLYRITWGLDQTLLRDCGSECTSEGDYITQFLERTARHVNDRFTGLIESSEDAVIRGYFGIGTNGGLNDCRGSMLVGQPMAADLFRMGLLDYQNRVRQYPGFSTFFPASSQHTWLNSESFYTGEVGGVRMVDWFNGILEGQPASHMGPE